MEPLFNSLIQIGIYVALIYVVGFIISLINRLFYFLAGTSKAVIYGTGFIGTPIHELSHAFFCLVFFHKIEEIKLFQINAEDGTLGYVNHSYHKFNPYQIIGNYFIGVAPILVGTSILMLLMWLIVPDTFNAINANFNSDVKEIGVTLWEAVKAFFLGASNYRWWLFLIPIIFIAIHMNLSKADLKGTLIAIPFIIALIIGLNYLIYAINKDAYAIFLSYASKGEAYLILILFMSLIFSLIALFPALIIYAFRRGGRKNGRGRY